MDRNHQTMTVVVIVGCLTLVAGCMTPAEQAVPQAAFDLHTQNIAPSSCFNERYEQPAAQLSRAIDILFVMDTSGSLQQKSGKVGNEISALVNELPPDVDYNIGVMLAHGRVTPSSASPWSGKLFTYDGKTIFNSKTMTLQNISTQLRNMIQHLPDFELGELGTYSLIEGITTNLKDNQKLGFFRPSAALAVIFVADENDICAPYRDQFEMSGGMTREVRFLRDRNCPGGIPTSQVISHVKALQGDRPYAFGAIVDKHTSNFDFVRYGHGWGYMEIVQETNGVSIEINDGTYAFGLSDMGKLVASKLLLNLDYPLAHANVDPTSIEVYIDRAPAHFVFDPIQNEVHLSEGGRALSIIDINYCLKTPAPIASPTPVPTPVPVPEPISTPSPEPAAPTSVNIMGFDAAMTSDTASVLWYTPGTPATTQLRWGTTVQVENTTILDKSFKEHHDITINGLQPNTNYYFQAVSADAAGDVATSMIVIKKTKP